MVLEDLSNDYHLVAHLKLSEMMEGHLEIRDRVLYSLHIKNGILITDVNVKSMLWFSPETDEKGILVEQLIAARNPCICNTAGHMATYVSPAECAETFIELPWLLLEPADKFMEDIPENVATEVRPQYTHRGANYKRFDNLLKVETEVLFGIEYLQKRAEKITAATQNTCDQALRKVTTQTPTNRWRDEAFETTRMVPQLRRKLKREKARRKNAPSRGVQSQKKAILQRILEEVGVLRPDYIRAWK
ncbi:hypothetical protein PR048_023666 [Dryococelus australis]|uniref:Uncharacterized protein n=1 Tax=Dryococelus australis TaxID=614101 RepID=A0ABQ9GUR9_9NEOP|nr:hypothetical protein PR048_023666 [Dryococelus australis]